MPHIHEKIDFVVGVYIVHQDKVLLIDHREQKKWLPIGGHIELDEDPEQALMREVEEESGLTQIEILSEKSALVRENCAEKDWKPLYRPAFLDIHTISKTHRHINLSYIAMSSTDRVRLAEREHHAIRWFSKRELHNTTFNIPGDVKYYAAKAIARVRNRMKKSA